MLSHEMSETKCGFFIFFTFKSISNHGALIVKEKLFIGRMTHEQEKL